MTINGAHLSFGELKAYLQGADDASLFEAARKTRAQIFGKDVFLRGIVEFSNHCKRRCTYCGLRADNTRPHRYRLSPQEIVDAAAQAPGLGLGSVVLQSGEDMHYDMQTIGAVVRDIKEQLGVAVTLSLGERMRDELAFWRDCGADRYLLKFETSNPVLHQQVRPGGTLSARLACLRTLQGLGYEAGSGVIVGLPGQTIQDLACDLLLLRELDLDMLSAGPFLPHPDTPLGYGAPGDVLLSLRVLALMRLMAPLGNIPASSALEVALPEGRRMGLDAGANVIMPTITPGQVRAGYSIYPGKNSSEDDVRALVAQVKKTIRDAGLTPSSGPGPSPRIMQVREEAYHG